MYTGSYAPWESAPKYLKHEQIVRPISVLDEFFQIGSVNDHAKRFKEWRDLVVSNGYYANKENGPGELLYTWQDHVNS
ncbi:hypothetical protein LLH06_00015 [Mucilaginibacter daejeonensis]|uniref:hypothetical protein n=1 Tax=Mucilaginibacter daejeonensis TaxID=398049 RepID=UPI001D170258|nr:hypothetical protein [Mucilaginibacter daejeonensis]UEG53366.1 hypothetical protein LLH06_00015 [Mucilaginibacter daejeonensis]